MKYDFNVYRVCLFYCVDLLVVSICHQCESTRKGFDVIIPVLLLIKRVTFSDNLTVLMSCRGTGMSMPRKALNGFGNHQGLVRPWVF